jgi:adenylate cyclase
LIENAGIRGRVDALIEGEERSAEISAGLVRIFAGFALGAVVMVTTHAFPLPVWATAARYWAATLVIGGFILSGLLALGVARSRFYRREMAFAFVAFDAALIGVFLHHSFDDSGLTGEFVAIFPAVWLLPLLLTVAVLRFRPGVQLFALASFAFVIVSIVLADGSTDLGSQQATARQIARYFAPHANLMRLALLMLAGVLLIMAASRGRRLLVRALDEAERRAALTRFLPAEIASLVTDATAGGLRSGRRQRAGILFVDIRDSTARAENLDPERLSMFVSAFRRRVTRAAEQHGGVIDKFVGDGALIVFGLPVPLHDDAKRALACAKTLLRHIDRWNKKRQFDPPVRVGIGVHVGEVFFGVVGDEKRMELTVLGDVVNVAARLEQATKTFTTPLLASAAAVEAAGEAPGWIEVSHEALRGRVAAVRVMRPVSPELT